MFKSDQLIYIQMQKTGCTHIASLLSSFFDGKQIGKHNAATEDQIAEEKFFISSIRNPWDWYLSLWTFGVQGNGALMHRLTQNRPLRFLAQTIKSPKQNWRKFLDEFSRDVSLWIDVYDNSDNVRSFRNWLKLIHSPSNSHILGEGYGNSEIASLCGFMTYRYLYLCCKNARELADSTLASDYKDLAQFERSNCYIDFFIRQESLESDLCEAIEKVRPLSHEEKEFIYGAKKINTSKRILSISDYYDEESIELVRSRDSLLIDKFGYSPPKIAEQEASPDDHAITAGEVGR